MQINYIIDYILLHIISIYNGFMARKVSKRKRSGREDFMLSEQIKVEAGMLDQRTILRIGKLFTHNIASRLMYMIGRGKESDIYLAEAGSAVKSKYVVVKIFRIETSSFGRRIDYMQGDPRFGSIKLSMFDIVNEWCKKEFSNLKIAEKAKVHAPKPYMFNGNVLAIELIGNDEKPAPQLRKVVLEDPEKVLSIILKDMKRLYSHSLVHADISEYNILMEDGMPYIIDFGQAVILGHPRASEFLERDLTNLLYYFSKKYGVGRDFDKTMGSIIGSEYI